MSQLQYLDDLYDTPKRDFWFTYSMVMDWLCINVGPPGDRGDLTNHDWAPSLTKMTHGGPPRGIYFAKDEDKVAFRLAFGIGLGR